MIEKIKTLRRELHALPEASGCEVETKKKIREFLTENTNLCVEDYNGGIIAYYKGEEDKFESFSDMIAFRADFDAVSLPDGTTAHLCGHDGHTAALLGVAMRLEELKQKRGVLLIFQPAEETGAGAKEMVDLLDRFAVSEIYGCHNLPGFDFGKVYTSLDSFACASCGITFYISGSPAHAAYPESGKSPIRVVTKLLEAIAESQEDDCFEEGTFATLIGSIIGQKAFGTSAEKAEVWVTVRSRSEKEFKRIKEYLEYTVKRACEVDGLSYYIELQDEFPATVNDENCARKILEKCSGDLLKEPMRWSEDFGHFLNKRCGAFFGIGAGDCPDLHTKDYEYPDELLENHIRAFIRLLK